MTTLKKVYDVISNEAVEKILFKLYPKGKVSKSAHIIKILYAQYSQSENNILNIGQDRISISVNSIEGLGVKAYIYLS